MKTERRHELQTNELADWLGKTIELVETNYRAVLGVIVAVVVVVGAGFYLSSESASRRTEAWDRYFQAQTSQDPISEMLTVSENYGGTSAGEWARLAVADYQLIIGTDQLFANRAEANDNLRKAIAGYQEIADSSVARREPLLEQRAILGLARGYESLNELDKARSEYEKLVDKSRWPHPAFAAEAQQRLDELNQTIVKGFYDWFARQEIKSPGGTPATTGLDNLNQLPDESQFKSSTITTEPSAEGAPSEAAPAESSPEGSTPAAPTPETNAAPSPSENDSSGQGGQTTPATTPSDNTVPSDNAASPDHSAPNQSPPTNP